MKRRSHLEPLACNKSPICYDIIWEISQYVDFDDFLNWRLVSRSAKAIIEHRNYEIECKNTEYMKKLKISEYFPNIQNLTIHINKSNKCIQYLPNQLKKMKLIINGKPDNISKNCLQYFTLYSYFDNIEELTIESTTFGCMPCCERLVKRSNNLRIYRLINCDVSSACLYNILHKYSLDKLEYIIDIDILQLQLNIPELTNEEMTITMNNYLEQLQEITDLYPNFSYRINETTGL